ncbi:Ribonuclease H [Ammonifex degensii KC4]|uniref:Ribonuclease HII n=1 Tax=Ammonifex degensii (strain DSM 10501 / KC4) TaxID=429009 RepID=C9R879_AMMDK|nr:ribonuclease HII [Ammonifex degensii]ACX52508.1 Ribonuclease H [Ammonifex degensii KC4]
MERWEEKFWEQGFRRVAGVDEAGRGPLAGPVVAAAVIFPPSLDLPLLKDSKLLSPKKRWELACRIVELAEDWAIGIGSVAEIDLLGIREATFRAMYRALCSLRLPPDMVLIDGNSSPPLPWPHLTIVKGDSRVASVAAASILAKVTRDRLMEDLHPLFPQYNFKRHKGYPTKEHKELLARYGPVSLHRRTFAPVRHFWEDKKNG